MKESTILILNGSQNQGASRGAIRGTPQQIANEESPVIDTSPITRMRNIEGVP